MKDKDWKAEYKQQLLSVCKYYHGEDKCPFPTSEDDNTKFMLWHGERAFYYDMYNLTRAEIQHECMIYQFHVGTELEARGYAVQRNAVLFNMYCKGFNSQAGAVSSFVKLMQDFYK